VALSLHVGGGVDDQAAWAQERRFWLEDPSAYKDLLDPACLMAFPGAGVMRAADILESLKGTPRWASVNMIDCKVARAGDSVIMLGYRVEGRREGADPYQCFCISTYRRVGNRWQLVQHQQTLAA
jgi:hypothetical protein